MKPHEKNLRETFDRILREMSAESLESGDGYYELLNFIRNKFQPAYLKAETKEELDRLIELYMSITGG